MKKLLFSILFCVPFFAFSQTFEGSIHIELDSQLTLQKNYDYYLKLAKNNASFVKSYFESDCEGDPNKRLIIFSKNGNFYCKRFGKIAVDEIYGKEQERTINHIARTVRYHLKKETKRPVQNLAQDTLILGYTCQKYFDKIDDKLSTISYATYQLPNMMPSSHLNHSQTAMPLYMEWHIEDVEKVIYVYRVTQILPQKIDDKIFENPEGYTVLGLEESQKKAQEIQQKIEADKKNRQFKQEFETIDKIQNAMPFPKKKN